MRTPLSFIAIVAVLIVGAGAAERDDYMSRHQPAKGAHAPVKSVERPVGNSHRPETSQRPVMNVKPQRPVANIHTPVKPQQPVANVKPQRPVVNVHKPVKPGLSKPHRPGHVYKPSKPHRPVHVYKPYTKPHYHVNRWVPHLPSRGVSFLFGGITYMMVSGLYYRPYNDGYLVVRPPYGAIVPILPAGYMSFYFDSRRYYYYNDIYYVYDAPSQAYRVVEDPIYAVDDEPYEGDESEGAGDVVDRLPEGAVVIDVAGVQYYRSDDAWYLPSVQNDRIVYIIVNEPEGYR